MPTRLAQRRPKARIKSAKPSRSNGAGRKRPKKLSRTRQPAEMGLLEWQTELRRQFGREQPLRIRNLGADPVFSEFAVTNPETQRTYRVVIRGQKPGVNYCSCPDYAVNTLGTCKHIEAALHRLARGHRKELQTGQVPEFAEVYVRYGAQRTVTFASGRDCPPKLVKLAARYFKADGSIKSTGYAGFNTFLRQAGKLHHDLRVYDDAMSVVTQIRDDGARRVRLQKRYTGPGSAARWNRLLKTRLFPYQRDGALFAAQAGRAVIADEMGLGKTIQAIAAAEMLAQNGGIERVLIVCPSSLKSQWNHEISRFSSRSASIIEGLAHRRRDLYRHPEGFFKIVNYDVVHRDLEAIQEWAPDLVILDEAQRIKNWQTRTAKSVKRITAPLAMVLTGTPLENRLEELHSIVEFVDRHRLGPLFAFRAAHEIREEDTGKVVGYRELKKVKKTLAPILIRRTKKQVLDQLPGRSDKNFFVPMTEPQWIPHDENKETVARVVQKWRRYGFLTEADQLRLRIALQYMRMSCDNTYLVDHQTDHGSKVPELATLLEEVFEEPGAKVVIFSQWLRMNELVGRMLEARSWGYVHLHGGVPARQRKGLTRALREDESCRVFLSTDAGGVGLNLQSASTVVNMDLPWNPAVLEQRIGRVHRLGQKRNVRVVNFVSEGTIEHGMLSLLKFKKSMFSGVLDGTADKVLMGDSALNRFMKTVESASSSVPDVAPTPEEESAGGEPAGSQVAAVAGLDGQALGQLLVQGAQWLQSLGRSLTEDGSTPSGSAAPAPSLRLDADADTGQRELRIAVPDRDTVQQWAGVLSDALTKLGSKRG
ncbi:MAG: DEAD/DEAH box helicase [Phycisphaerae bacterium]